MPFVKENYYFNHELNKSDVSTKIVVGSKTGKFVPNINFSKWSDEAWLNINYPISISSQLATYDAVNDKISIVVGDFSFNWYVHPDDSLEFEIVLGKRPPGNQNTFTFNIDFSPGLKFFYQDSLENEYAKLIDPSFTLLEFLSMVNRPENVVGSYAVYHDKKHNTYKTGKLCHIYRPKFIDSLGNSVWANLSIDPIAKTLTISVDANFIKNATYPVTIDPNVGYDGAGSSDIGTSNYALAVKDTIADGGGNTVKMHAIVSNADSAHNIKAALYSDDNPNTAPEALQGTQVQIAVPNMAKGEVNGNYVVAVTDGTWWAAVIPDSGFVRLYYDNGGQYGVGDPLASFALPDPWDHAGDEVWGATFSWCVWADYTAGGGGAATPSGVLKAGIIGGSLRGSSGSSAGSCLPDEIKIKRRKKRGE